MKITMYGIRITANRAANKVKSGYFKNQKIIKVQTYRLGVLALTVRVEFLIK